MRKSELKPLTLYATNSALRSAARRSAGPALLLDTRWWDLLPKADGPAITLAPEDATRSAVLNGDTGARRGLLVVQAEPAMAFTRGFDKEAVAAQLSTLAEEEAAKGVARLDRCADARLLLDNLRQALAPGLILNVVLLGGLQQPWGSQKTLPCPACGADADLDSAGRLRPHVTRDGKRCTPQTYRCPVCKKPVGLDTANRVLFHEVKGERCSMTNTQMSPEVRNACLISQRASLTP